MSHEYRLSSDKTVSADHGSRCYLGRPASYMSFFARRNIQVSQHLFTKIKAVCRVLENREEIGEGIGFLGANYPRGNALVLSLTDHIEHILKHRYL